MATNNEAVGQATANTGAAGSTDNTFDFGFTQPVTIGNFVWKDTNGDGHVDIQDSRYLYDAVERMLARPGFQTLQGGLGFYPATSGHPPFVHLDVRGTKARWQG